MQLNYLYCRYKQREVNTARQAVTGASAMIRVRPLSGCFVFSLGIFPLESDWSLWYDHGFDYGDEARERIRHYTPKQYFRTAV